MNELSPSRWWADGAKLFRAAVLGLCVSVVGGTYNTGVKIIETQEVLVEQVQQIRDEMDATRAATTEVVIWAPAKSQELTDQEGVCDTSRDDACVIILRGRRTIDGLSCVTSGAEVKVVVNETIRNLELHPSFVPVQLGLDFRNIAVPFIPQPFIPSGPNEVFVVVLYMDCSFAGELQQIERPTIAVTKEFI